MRKIKKMNNLYNIDMFILEIFKKINLFFVYN